MRKFVFGLFVLFIVSSAHAQINDSGNHGFMTITTKSGPEEEMVGSPFYEDENFKEGVIYINGKEPLDVFLRYNVVAELMEIKLDLEEEETFKLPYNEKVVYEMGNRRFILDKKKLDGKQVFGYFIEYAKGDKVRLLGKPMAEVYEAVGPKTGYDTNSSPRVKIEEVYYVILENGDVEEIRTKNRDVKKIFGSGISKEYLKNNRVRSLQDLISFVEFFNNRQGM